MPRWIAIAALLLWTAPGCKSSGGTTPTDAAGERAADQGNDRTADSSDASASDGPGGDGPAADAASDGSSPGLCGSCCTRAGSCPGPGTSALPAGTTYHVCACGAGADSDCQAGADGNDGTSPTAPWASYEKARAAFGTLSAGETIAFCRGGAFSAGASKRWVNSACTAASPCVVRDYDPPWASGDEGRPIIRSDAEAFNLADSGSTADHEEGYLIINLELRGAGSGAGVFIYNDVDDVLLENLVVDGFALGVHVAGSKDPGPGSNAKNERITLRSSRIVNNSGQGWLGGCDDCVIENNLFDNNGFAKAIYNHNIYLGSSGGPTSGMRVRCNELYRSAIVGGKCEGTSLVVHGEHDDLVVENNLVREDVGAAAAGCWGIAVDTGYAGTPESFSKVAIRGNTVINVGNTPIGLNACVDCTVENNVVIHEQPITVTAIAVPNRSRGGEDGTSDKIRVRNNSIYIDTEQGGTGIRFGGEGDEHVLASNAVYYAGGSNSWDCFDLQLGDSGYQTVDNNLCYYPGASGGEWESGSGALAAWQGASPFDDSSLVADPGYAAPAAGDLAPAAGSSPLVGAGHATASAPRDFHCQTRSDPDIGAFEW